MTKCFRNARQHSARLVARLSAIQCSITRVTANAFSTNGLRLLPDGLRHSRPSHLIIVLGILLVIAIFAVAAGLILNLRDRALAEKGRVLENLALVLAEQIDRSFQSIELIQKSEMERMRNLGVTSPEELQRQMSGLEEHLRLKDRVDALPYIDAIVVTDANGKLINFSRTWPAPDVRAPDQDPSPAFWADPKLISFVGKPVRSPVTGKWLIPLARKFSGPHGEFLGVVTGVISVQYLEQVFATVADKPNGTIVLFNGDGTLLVRFPHQESVIGQGFSRNVFLEVLDASNRNGGRLISAIDGQDRLFSARRLADYRVSLVATTRVADVLANWRRGAAIVIVVALMTGVVIGAGVFFSVVAVGRKLHEQKGQRDAAFQNMSQGLCMFNSKQQLIVCNQQYAGLYRLTADCTKPGTSLRTILEHRAAVGQTPENHEKYIDDRLREVAQNVAYHVVNRLQDGRYISVVHRPTADGGWVATHEDITEFKRNEQALVRAHQEVIEKQFAIDQAVIVAITDVRGTITYANDNFCKISGYTREELLGTNHRILKSGIHSDSYFREMYRRIAGGHVWRGEICNRAKDGSLYWVDTTIVPECGLDGKPVSYMAIRIDITAHKVAEEKISYLARHDGLTGLNNRAYFTESLDDVLARHSRNQESCVVMLLDLDGFKHVNDTLGHAAGDKLLKELARRLKSSLRETDVLARLGGDEFVVLQSGLENPRDAAVALAVRLLDVVGEPINLDGHDLTVGTSIGIAVAPQDGADSGDLLKKADLALYRVKSEGRNNFRFFDEEMGKGAAIRLQLIKDMREAIKCSEFELHYQPIFDAKTQQVCGAEALVRWRHPVEGLLPPDRFIPLAEESGLMEPLGEWILERACTDAAKWPSDVKVAVNLSAAQFRSGRLFDAILCALVDSELPPERLELEITESVLLHNAEDHIVTIQQLKNIGISIALDDFGTGYSSLSYLTKFPFDKIKIDRSFTQGLTERPDCAAIVASVLTLARGLDICVTAEGVETSQQFELLRATGIQQVQGYLFSRPRIAAEFDFRAIERDARIVTNA